MNSRLRIASRQATAYHYRRLRQSLSVQTTATNVLILALGIVNSIILARILEPTGRGELAAAMLWPVTLTYLASLSFIDAIIYFTALQETRIGAIATIGAISALVQSAIAMPIGYMLMPHLLASQRPEVIAICRMYLLVIPVSLVTQYAIAIIQGQLRIRTFNVLRIVIPAGYLFGTLVLYATHDVTVDHIIWLNLLLNVVALLLSLTMLPWSELWPDVGFHPQLGKEMLRYGLLTHVGSLSQGVNVRLDQVLMAAWLPAAQLGLYVAAVSASSVAQTVSTAVTMVLTPRMAQQKEQHQRVADLLRMFRRYWTFTLLTTPPLAMAIYWGIPILFGSSFRSATWTAEVLLLAGLCLGAKNVLAGGAKALGDPWLASRSELVAVAITIGTLPILIPAIGIIGAAFVSLAAYAFALLVLSTGLGRHHGVSSEELFSIDTDAFRAVTGEWRAALNRARKR